MECGLRALSLKPGGEVITTPFTFAATAHAIRNAGLKATFVDIRPDNYTINPSAVEAAVSEKTVAIVGVHVFGAPCDYARLETIAKAHGLAVFYDAAHSFGMNVDGRSIGLLGDMSMFSFHATKVFHSVEGGMLMSTNDGWIKEATALANFGLRGDDIQGAGTNAKMSELHAVVGLSNLKHIDAILARRRHQGQLYRRLLDGIPGIHLQTLPDGDADYNFSYMPIEVVPDEYGCDRDTLQTCLAKRGVGTRRYFYPQLANATAFAACSEMVGPLPVATRLAKRVICLPLYHRLEDVQIRDIVRIVERRASL